MRALAVIVFLLSAPAAAIEVECPGSTWYGSDLNDCPCCEQCPDGRWRIEGDTPCLSFSEAAQARLEALPDSERYKTVGPEPEPEPRLFSILVGSVGDLIALALSVLAACVVAGLYFLPFILAKSRKHHQSDAILLTNIFLGWTGLGWIFALIWSATATEGKKK